MNENSTDGFTRRQAIVGAALVGLTVAAKTTLAQTETIALTKPPTAPPSTQEELGLWTLDLATGITKGKSLSDCLTICSLNTKNSFLRRISDNMLKNSQHGIYVIECNGTQ